MRTILYISDVNASEAIFHSQVFPHINALKNEYRIVLIGMRRNTGDKFEYDYSYRSIRGDFHYPLAYLNFLRQKKAIKMFLNKMDIDVIYSRGFRGGLLGRFIKRSIYNSKAKLVNDVRADVLDEHKGNWIDKTGFYFTIRFVFKSADSLFFVSSYLRDKYQRIFNYKDPIAICPTFVPDNKFFFSPEVRIRTREELGYSEADIVLLYSGNLAKWQNIEVILDVFSNSSNPSLRLLILTKDPEIYKMIEQNRRKDRIAVLSVDYESIQRYYCSADYGVLIRDNIPTNICSAPTKFSEYINSGLEIIGTRITSDYCDFLKDKKQDDFLVENKGELLQLFDRLTKVFRKRENRVNLLSDIISTQIPFFENN